MEPYIVAGLARRENEAVDCEPEDLDPGIVRAEGDGGAHWPG